MFMESNICYILTLLLFTLTTKADHKKNQFKNINNTFTNEKENGSGSHSMSFTTGTANRSRKDYIIAIEDNAPMNERVDPLFRSLQRLAKRTRGKMAVMDYAKNEEGFNFPLGNRLGYRNEIANDDYNDDDNYDDGTDEDDDDYDANNDGYNEEFGSRLGGKQRLIGTNVIKNLLGLNFAMEGERPRQKEEVQGPEELSFEDKNADFAPPVVYEIRGNKRDDYADYPDDEDENQVFSKSSEPLFLFGNDKK